MKPTRPQFNQWLSQATATLKPNIASSVVQELQAHYEDAICAYLAAGYSPEEAHYAAMQDLGDAQLIAQAFHHHYQTDRRHRKAGLLGIICGGLYLISIPLYHALGGQGFNSAVFLLVLYILYSFDVLFTSPLSGRDVTFYKRLIVHGIVVVCLTRLVGWLLFQHPMVTESYHITLRNIASPLEWFINVVSLGALFVIAATLISLGEHGWNSRDSFHRLLRPLSVAVVLCGTSLAIYGIATTDGLSTYRIFGAHLTIATSGFACLLWVGIFLMMSYPKAVYRS